jgi:hypothetical protein
LVIYNLNAVLANLYGEGCFAIVSGKQPFPIFQGDEFDEYNFVIFIGHKLPPFSPTKSVITDESETAKPNKTYGHP